MFFIFTIDIGGTPIDQFRTISQQRPSVSIEISLALLKLKIKLQSFYQQSASSSKQSIYEG